MISRNGCIAFACGAFLLAFVNFIAGLGAVVTHDPLWLVGVKFASAAIWFACCAVWVVGAITRE